MITAVSRAASSGMNTAIRLPVLEVSELTKSRRQPPQIETEGRHSRASLRFWARSDDELAKRLEPLPAQDHTCKSIRDHAHSDFGGRVACSRRGARSHPLPVSTARGVQRTDYRCQLH